MAVKTKIEIKNRDLKNFEAYLKDGLENEADLVLLAKVVDNSSKNVLARVTSGHGDFNNASKGFFFGIFAKPILTLVVITTFVVLTTVSVAGIVLYQHNAPDRHINQTLNNIDKNLQYLQTDENTLQQSDQDLNDLGQSV